MYLVPAASRGARTRRTLLQAGSAAAALLAFSAASAHAQEAEPPLDIEVGDIFTNGYAAHGVVGVTTDAPITVKAGTIVTEGPVSHGIVTYSENGDTVVTATAVGTFGDESIGIAAQSENGDVTVNVGEVLTTGAISDAVIASSRTGDVTVNMGKVRTEGLDAWGLWAVSETGKTTVDVGSVETLRDGGIGLVVGGGAGASVTVDSIKTSGYGANGVQMVAGNYDYGLVTFGDAVLRAGSVETKGAHATAVSVVAIGNADVAVADTRTYGEFADGVTTYSMFGDSQVVVGNVHTSGFSALGVRSGTDDGNLTLRVGEVLTEGDFSAAVSTRVRTGDLDLVVGDVTTRGQSSYGVISTVLRGTNGVTTEGVIQTSGDHAHGVMTSTAGHTSIAAADIRTTGDGANGIDAFAAWADWAIGNDRSMDIVAASITTQGDNAHGINIIMPHDGWIIGSVPRDAVVRPAPGADAPVSPAAPGDFNDDITIRAGKVVVAGEGSVGIRVQGLAAIDIEADNVTSEQAEAIVVDARGDATIKLNGAISGGGDSAVRVSGENVNVDIAKTAVVTGEGDALVLAAVGPWTPPPPEEPLPEEPGAMAPASPGIVTLGNEGVIRAGTGAAIRVTSGTAMIDNSGRIEGSLILGDGDDVVTNTGTLVMTADNDFGTGDDLFTNKGGVVKFGEAEAPLNLSFLGLESFVNEGGLIDLRNERAGDTLTLGGTYAASGDARLALDVGDAAVDRLVVLGAATGKTSIVLQAENPEDAVLLDETVSLVTVGQGSAAGAFTIAESNVGLVRYGLTFDAQTNAYVLDTSAGRAVEQSVLTGEGLISNWRASADAFNAEQAMARAAGGESGRVWAQAHGSVVDRDGETPEFAYEHEITGGQMGVSFGSLPMWGGAAAFGVTGGFVDSTMTYEDDGQEVDVQSINAGVYGVWNAENLFATGLVKVDHHSLEIDDNAAGFEADVDGLSWGVQLAAGYRFEAGRFVLEPMVGLDYLSSSLDDLNALDQSVSFEDHDGFSARIGGQASTRHELSNGRAITWSAGLEAVHDFDAEYGATLVSNDQSDDVLIEAVDTYGLARIGAQFEVGGGLETYVQGEGRFGDGESGGGLRIGARYRF